MKKLMLVTLIAGSLFAAVGCAKKNSSNDGGKPTESEGTSSGGGSFGDENSMRLLGWGKKIVADSLRRTNPKSLQGLPVGWTPERLAKLVENTKSEPNKVVYRYGRELMFDYKVPKSGEPYLIATSLFFRSHAAIPVNSLWDTQKEPYIREIRTKLLHEAAHVLGIGLTEKTDHKARGFAYHLIADIFAKNNVLCSTQSMPENYEGFVSDQSIEDHVRATFTEEYKHYSEDQRQKLIDEKIEEAKARKYYWMINRPSGFGFQVRKEEMDPKGFMPIEDYPWMQKLLAGNGEAHYLSPIRMIHHKKNPNSEIEMYEPKREFTLAIFGKGRLQQQYYKSVETQGGAIIFKGEVTGFDENSECSVGEQLTFPLNKDGKYEATLKYFNQCPSLISPSKSKEAIVGEMKVQCVESVPRLSDLNQFYNEGPYLDKSLNDYEKYKNDLD